MAAREPRVTEYISARAPYARPVLRKLRRLIHEGAPGLEESIKWGMPTFLHRGKIVCGIAGFKQHCALWFWNGKAVVGDHGRATGPKALGQFGRIARVEDLPPTDVVHACLRNRIHEIDGAASTTSRSKH